MCVMTPLCFGIEDNIKQTRQYALIFLTSYPNATFLRVSTQGVMTPKFELGRDVCRRTMHLPTKFDHPICLLVRKLSCSQTNRRRWKHPTLFATLRRGGKHAVHKWHMIASYRVNIFLVSNCTKMTHTVSQSKPAPDSNPFQYNITRQKHIRF